MDIFLFYGRDGPVNINSETGYLIIFGKTGNRSFYEILTFVKMEFLSLLPFVMKEIVEEPWKLICKTCHF